MLIFLPIATLVLIWMLIKMMGVVAILPIIMVICLFGLGWAFIFDGYKHDYLKQKGEQFV
jgi:positive regulator of sigma E activity